MLGEAASPRPPEATARAPERRSAATAEIEDARRAGRRPRSVPPLDLGALARGGAAGDAHKAASASGDAGSSGAAPKVIRSAPSGAGQRSSRRASGKVRRDRRRGSRESTPAPEGEAEEGARAAPAGAASATPPRVAGAQARSPQTKTPSRRPPLGGAPTPPAVGADESGSSVPVAAEGARPDAKASPSPLRLPPSGGVSSTSRDAFELPELEPSDDEDGPGCDAAPLSPASCDLPTIVADLQMRLERAQGERQAALRAATRAARAADREAREAAALAREHAEECEALQARADERAEAVRAECAAEVRRVRAECNAELDLALRDRDAEARRRADLEATLAAADGRRAAELDAVEKEHADALAQICAQHEAQVASLRAERDAARAQTRRRASAAEAEAEARARRAEESAEETRRLLNSVEGELEEMQGLTESLVASAEQARADARAKGAALERLEAERDAVVVERERADRRRVELAEELAAARVLVAELRGREKRLQEDGAETHRPRSRRTASLPESPGASGRSTLFAQSPARKTPAKGAVSTASPSRAPGRTVHDSPASHLGRSSRSGVAESPARPGARSSRSTLAESPARPGARSSRSTLAESPARGQSAASSRRAGASPTRIPAVQSSASRGASPVRRTLSVDADLAPLPEQLAASERRRQALERQLAATESHLESSDRRLEATEMSLSAALERARRAEQLAQRLEEAKALAEAHAEDLAARLRDAEEAAQQALAGRRTLEIANDLALGEMDGFAGRAAAAEARAADLAAQLDDALGRVARLEREIERLRSGGGRDDDFASFAGRGDASLSRPSVDAEHVRSASPEPSEEGEGGLESDAGSRSGIEDESSTALCAARVASMPALAPLAAQSAPFERAASTPGVPRSGAAPGGAGPPARSRTPSSAVDGAVTTRRPPSVRALVAATASILLGDPQGGEGCAASEARVPSPFQARSVSATSSEGRQPRTRSPSKPSGTASFASTLLPAETREVSPSLASFADATPSPGAEGADGPAAPAKGDCSKTYCSAGFDVDSPREDRIRAWGVLRCAPPSEPSAADVFKPRRQLPRSPVRPSSPRERPTKGWGALAVVRRAALAVAVAGAVAATVAGTDKGRARRAGRGGAGSRDVASAAPTAASFEPRAEAIVSGEA